MFQRWLESHLILPVFQLCQLWRDEVLGLGNNTTEENVKTDGEVVAVNTWLARMTLDVIGESTLHYSSSLVLASDIYAQPLFTITSALLITRTTQ